MDDFASPRLKSNQVIQAGPGDDRGRPARGPHPFQTEERPADVRYFDFLDEHVRGLVARTTGGAPLLAGLSATQDWAVHLSQSPGRVADLWIKAWVEACDLALYALERAGGDGAEPPRPLSESPRFASEGWMRWPYDLAAQSWLAASDWWRSATAHARGLNAWSAEETAFMADLALQALSPANIPWLNPDIVERTRSEGGANFLRGWAYALDDLKHLILDQPADIPSDYVVGETLATTPGDVVLRTELMELIQYRPQTDTVRSEPILIVPAWIMKYYILDLSQRNSLVNWLVGQGFSVFMISWRNPGPDQADCGMDAYLELGVSAAVDAVETITGSPKLHACGYCLGGTLLALASAAMAGRGDDRLASISLLAAQTDFTEPGELRLLVDEAQVTFLEDMMAQTGVMPAQYMSGGFKMLRSDTQIWEHAVRSYFLGERPEIFDILAWNIDATRMPEAMMQDYLRGLYLENRLARGRYLIDGRAVSISDISAPVFALGAARDHVAPWRSIYKIVQLADTDVTFALTTGGHNAGIVSEPGHPGRRLRVKTIHKNDYYLSPEAWIRESDAVDGSWWPAWREWLASAGSPGDARPPPQGDASKGYPILGDAPGKYVRER